MAQSLTVYRQESKNSILLRKSNKKYRSIIFIANNQWMQNHGFISVYFKDNIHYPDDPDMRYNINLFSPMTYKSKYRYSDSYIVKYIGNRNTSVSVPSLSMLRQTLATFIIDKKANSAVQEVHSDYQTIPLPVYNLHSSANYRKSLLLSNYKNQ